MKRSLRDQEGRILATPPALRALLLGEAHEEVDAGFQAAFAPLLDLVEQGHVDPHEIGVATVFTVDRFTDTLVAVRDHIHGLPALELLPEAFEVLSEKKGYTLYEGAYVAPNYQRGTKPYISEGGGIELDANGAPIVAEWETIRFAVSIPEGTAPLGGWPIVMFGHGTGGNYLNFAQSGKWSPAPLLAELGVAMIGIDQPLHGTRWDGPASMVDMLSFNFLNPEAGRTSFRQSAIDFFSLTRVVREVLEIPSAVAVDGKRHVFDPDRVGYYGNSHGGLGGALFGAVETDVRGIVLSGAGAGLAQTLMLRKDPLDIHETLHQLLGTVPGELTDFHPVVTLVQSLVDITDPMNYAPHLVRGSLRQGAPIHLLVTEGTKDDLTPPITTESLAAAAGLPILAPFVQASDALLLSNTEILERPLSANLATATGDPVTGALIQHSKYGHFLVFQNEDVARLCARFLKTAVEPGIALLD